MPRKTETTAAVVATLTPEQRAAAHALAMRDATLARSTAAADAVREYAGATAQTVALGAKCFGTFAKRLVFGAPKHRVEIDAVQMDDAELRAVLAKHGLL